MPVPPRRALTALVLVAGVAVAGCAPHGLDAQQRQLEARECASLLERHVSGRGTNDKIVLDGTTIDLHADPEGFYRALEEDRGPDAFPLTGEKAVTSQRASFISDLCKAKDASSSRLRSSSTTSTTTTTEPTRTSG